MPWRRSAEARRDDALMVNGGRQLPAVDKIHDYRKSCHPLIKSPAAQRIPETAGGYGDIMYTAAVEQEFAYSCLPIS
jgi:hypothetical protein